MVTIVIIIINNNNLKDVMNMVYVKLTTENAKWHV